VSLKKNRDNLSCVHYSISRLKKVRLAMPGKSGGTEFSG
jgi:hypothetical protein